MFITTVNNIEWFNIIENLWEVTGLSANTKSIIWDTISDIRDIFWWQMKTNMSLMYLSKDNALEALIEKAKEKWADAIVGLRYQTISVNWWIWFIAYWTAVKVDWILPNNEKLSLIEWDKNYNKKEEK